MNAIRGCVVTAVLLATHLTAQNSGQGEPHMPERLIDMHVHAWQAPPRDEHFRQSLQRAFAAFNVERVIVSGPATAALAAVELVPRLMLAGAADGAGVALPESGEFAEMVQNQRIAILGELDGAWDGLPLTAARLQPYLSIAERRDTPVAVFSGVVPPGAATKFPRYRAEFGRPAAIEPLMARYSGLRVYLMQAGWPFLDETIAVMHVYPDVYADLGNLAANPTIPREEFYRYLRALVGAGLGNRLMFGSGLDIMDWAGGIGQAVKSVADAPFLSPSERADIFYRNAERFLKLKIGEPVR